MWTVNFQELQKLLTVLSNTVVSSEDIISPTLLLMCIQSHIGYDYRFGRTSAVQSMNLCCQKFRRIRFCHKYNIMHCMEVSASLYKHRCKLVCTAIFTSLFSILYQPFVSGSDVTLLAQ
jgi:hypothetical protein